MLFSNFHLFNYFNIIRTVLKNSGITGRFCSSKWSSLEGNNSAFSDVGSSSASACCKPGSKINATDSLSCVSCPVATFSTISDAEECTECVRGNCSAAGSTSCATCKVLPNGNGDPENGANSASDRVGSLGGLVDDIYQDYRDASGNNVSKPSNSMTKTEVIAMYGNIEDWIVSHITNMAYLFYNKKTANPDLSQWVIPEGIIMDSSK